MPKAGYEYKVVNISLQSPPHVTSPEEFNEWLAQEVEKNSADGWELCATDGTRFFFKRAKVPS